MFFKIVVPLDGSSYSEAALKSASFMARAFNAELKLVTVEDVPLPIYPGEVDPEMLNEGRKDHEASLNTPASRRRLLRNHCRVAARPPRGQNPGGSQEGKSRPDCHGFPRANRFESHAAGQRG